MWIYSKIHPACANDTYHNVTDLVNDGIIKNTKTWVSWGQNISFLQNKKILSLCLRWHILRSYHFVEELTFNSLNYLLALRVNTAKAPQSFSRTYRNDESEPSIDRWFKVTKLTLSQNISYKPASPKATLLPRRIATENTKKSPQLKVPMTIQRSLEIITTVDSKGVRVCIYCPESSLGMLL